MFILQICVTQMLSSNRKLVVVLEHQLYIHELTPLSSKLFYLTTEHNDKNKK